MMEDLFCLEKGGYSEKQAHNNQIFDSPQVLVNWAASEALIKGEWNLE